MAKLNEFKTTGTLAEQVARMAKQLNKNLRDATKNGYMDFAEYKFIEKSLTNTLFASKPNARRIRESEATGERLTTYAIEDKPAQLQRRFTEEQLKEYKNVLENAQQKIMYVKGKAGAEELKKRSEVFKERIERTTGETIDITKVYDIVKIQSAGLWKKLTDLKFASAQIIKIVQTVNNQKLIHDRLNHMLDFYEDTGLPFNKNETLNYIIGNTTFKAIVQRYYNMGALSEEWGKKLKNKQILN